MTPINKSGYSLSVSQNLPNTMPILIHPTSDPYSDLWTGPGTIAAFMLGFTLFMFMFILIIRVSLALTRASMDRRTRTSAWVTAESGQANRLNRTRRSRVPMVAITTNNRLTTMQGNFNQGIGSSEMTRSPDAPPAYEDICFCQYEFNQNNTNSPQQIHQQNKIVT